MPAVATAGGLPPRLGKYELLLPLATGGMARIYIGRSTGIGSFERHVVLKMITPEKANDLTAVNMFLDEARLAASLNHQNVAQVFEVGEDGGIHYLAMEYVHGQDLRAVLAKAGSAGTRIPLELALTVVAGAAAGLHHAHERRGPDGVPLGIVHRDVSPSNIMIGYDGAVKLLDFGIAKATARSVETQSGIIKGKFAYMAPEQCRGRDVDRRSDVFSLGIILYEVSTQHRCFRADSDFDTMHRIVTGDVIRPSRLVQGYPPALEAIVMKALASDPAQRYQSSGLLLEALESFAVSSRMSLSTMGLGRFMRDMFGEVQEPWLMTAATKVLQPIVHKESTISSTDGQGRRVRAPDVAPELDVNMAGIPDEEAAFPDSAKAEAAKTTLDLPRDLENDSVDGPPDDWNAKSYPAPPPSMSPPMPQPDVDAYPTPPTTIQPVSRASQPPSRASQPAPRASQPHAAPLMLPPDIIGAETPPHGLKPPSTAPIGTMPPAELPLPAPPLAPQMPLPQAVQFNVPGSGSGPSLPAMGVSTKHGYASAVSHSETSYPRYDDAVHSDVQLTPNRRPLFIGLGIVVAGVIVMLVVSFGGGSNEPAPPTRVDEPAQTNPATEQMAATPDQPSKGSDDVVEESMVSVVIHSDPSGADVLIAGTKIGTTPFESKLKRGTKVAQLTVQKTGYAPFNTKIDLGGEYENRNIKLSSLEDMAKGSDASVAPPGTPSTKVEKPPVDKAPVERPRPKTQPKTISTPAPKREKKDDKKEEKREEKKEEKGCQPPGPNVDPFGLPVCKP